MKDIMDMSLPQLEMILEGISKNNKKLEEAIANGGQVQEKSALDLLNYLEQNGGEL